RCRSSHSWRWPDACRSPLRRHDTPVAGTMTKDLRAPARASLDSALCISGRCPRGNDVIKRCMLVLCLGVGGVAAAQEPVDLDMVNRIRQEAFHNSQVMATFSHLTE